jgi:hypothetical protein
MAAKVKQDPPDGVIDKHVETYKGFQIVKATSMYGGPIVFAPTPIWYVRLPDGDTWLYSEGDDPNDILMFGKPRYARQAIDKYLLGQRRFEIEMK